MGQIRLIRSRILWSFLIIGFMLVGNLYAVDKDKQVKAKDTKNENTLNELYRQQYENLSANLQDRALRKRALFKQAQLELSNYAQYGARLGKKYGESIESANRGEKMSETGKEIREISNKIIDTKVKIVELNGGMPQWVAEIDEKYKLTPELQRFVDEAMGKKVDIEAGGKKSLVYIDSSLNKIDVSKIPLDDAIVMGDEKAKYHIIVFDDPDCPYSARLHQEMKKVIEKRKDIAFFIKMFPMKIHPGAYEKAKAIVCEKSLKLLDDAFEKKELPKPKCETSVVDENMKLAEELGITGTPALIMPDSRVMPGYRKADAIIELLGS